MKDKLIEELAYRWETSELLAMAHEKHNRMSIQKNKDSYQFIIKGNGILTSREFNTERECVLALLCEAN